MRSSYLRVVTFYIHPFLELTLIKFFLTFSYRQELPPSLRRFTPLQSTHARSGRVETASLKFKRACTPDFECRRSLPDM
jgi:hypothetical protein